MESSSIILDSKSTFEREFDQWKIIITKHLDFIKFKIETEFDIYESSFNFNYLQSFNLLSSNLSIEQMIDCFINNIDEKRINIQEKEKAIELIFLSHKRNIPNVELRIEEKSKLSEEFIEKLIKQIKKIKEENKKFELRFKNIEKKENEKQIKKEVNNSNKNIKDNSKKIKKQLTNCNLEIKSSIKAHTDNIYSLSIFPSGNIISVSKDKSIRIFDNQLKNIQKILNAHENSITYVSVKDENNFVTCSFDKNIKTWFKNETENKYSLNNIIEKAHEGWISKVIYSSNGNIISCSQDKTIKMWEIVNNDNYQCISILKNINLVNSILLFEDKNILISSGLDGTKFWDLNNYKNIIHIEKAICQESNALNKIDEDRIIVGGNTSNKELIIISIKEKKIIKKISNEFLCCGICVIEDKGIFLIGGISNDIKIYRSDNYECIKEINDAHKDNNISGIIKFKNDDEIISYGSDKIIKIWKLEY